MKIKFDTLSDAMYFSIFASSLNNSNIDLICGRISVDAKSLIGVTSLDLTKVYDVQFQSSDENEINLFLEHVEPLLVK